MLAKIILVLAIAALFPLACSSDASQRDAGSMGGGAGTTGVAGAGGFAGAVGAAGRDAGAGAGGFAGVGGAAGRDGGSDASGSACGPDADVALIVPAGLNVSLEAGGAGVFDLLALTLREAPDGLKLDASLRNDGNVPACDAAFKVQLFDTSGQPLGEWINGLYTSHFYLYTVSDASTTIAACASPGDVTMTEIAITASNIALADVGKVVYYYSYFVLDAVPIDGLAVSGVGPAATDGGISYTGMVINNLDATVSAPSVAVFPLNCVGRPLGIATASGSGQVAAGGSWTFQTNTVDTPGVNQAAYPAASFGN